MNIHEYHDGLHRFAFAQSIEEITNLCQSHCKLLGFDRFIYALRIPNQFSDSRVIVVKGYPDAWLDRYWANSYHTHDPVIAYCGQSILPIKWQDLIVDSSSTGARIMHEAVDFGLRSGITMPVHSPHGELGVLSFALDWSVRSAHEVTTQAMPCIQLLATSVHEAVKRVSGMADTPAVMPLTPREEECLRWTADGKTSWEIGQLLHTSERTVNFHLTNSMKKLDVCNRQHAVAKAVLQGLISPYPF